MLADHCLIVAEDGFRGVIPGDHLARSRNHKNGVGGNHHAAFETVGLINPDIQARQAHHDRHDQPGGDAEQGRRRRDDQQEQRSTPPKIDGGIGLEDRA